MGIFLVDWSNLMVQGKGLYCLMIDRFARIVWIYSQKAVAPAEV